MRYLGLDLGSRTLGISISDRMGLIASSYKVLRHNEEYDKLVSLVKKIVEDEDVDEIVLGFPKNMDNTIGFKGEISLSFKEKLEKNIGIKVNLQDERLTTVEAERILISNNTTRKNRKKVIDSMAATIILQSFLERKDK